MSSPYKRRRPALLRNLWVYRYLIAAACVLGVMLWFVLINNTAVKVVFPFGLGTIESKLGIVILLAAAAGGLATALLMTLTLALRRLRSGPPRVDDGGDPFPDDRPPADYASKATEGFPDPRAPHRNP
ncbi:MAG TPA: DUF1049 domain-containing protein [Isosphaeraceae bacterium]|jgi:uncharacterized integral membrane protein|nr:DUF1049 domain-containing protein [Isosphaeraceae bacterium]